MMDHGLVFHHQKLEPRHLSAFEAFRESFPKRQSREYWSADQHRGSKHRRDPKTQPCHWRIRWENKPILQEIGGCSG